MQQIAQFFKVSEEQFVRDWCTATRRSADEAKKVYQNKLSAQWAQKIFAPKICDKYDY